MKAKKEPETAWSAGEEGLSDHVLERLVAGDLPPARADAVRARLLADPEGRARLSRLQASNDEILRSHPPSVVAAEIERRLDRAARAQAERERRPRSWRLNMTLGLPVLAAAVTLVMGVRGGWLAGAHPGAGTPVVDDSGDTLKGLRPSLRVYRKVAGRVERLQDGAPTRAGDELQLAYVAAGHRYGAVASADGAGHVTYHLPSVAGPAVRLRTEGETVLPTAYELDAAPGFERFVFVTSDEPFDASVLAAIASGQAPAPADKVAVVFTVKKP